MAQPELNLDSILENLEELIIGGGFEGQHVQLRGAVTKIANQWTPGANCPQYFELDIDGVRIVEIPISFYPPQPVSQFIDAGNNFQYLAYRGLLQTKKFVFAADDDQCFENFHTAVLDHLPGQIRKTNEGMHTLEKAVEAYGIRGRIDCLLEYVTKAKSCRIIDFKWTKNEKDPDPTPQQGLQLLLYQWLLGKMRKDKNDVTFVMREDKDDVPAEMFLIRYNDTRKELKRFLFKPPPECQYSKEKSDQKDFEGAIHRYMQ